MRTLTVGELKAQFSQIIKDVKAGEEIAVAFGKKREVIAYLVPKPERKLGILQGKGKAIFTDDFKMTEEEFLGLGVIFVCIGSPNPQLSLLHNYFGAPLGFILLVNIPKIDSSR
ncbi:type II toxin-antitoxin system Phd/YefM family antitoxin [Salmonirosea aquatica]|uniref:type II toxin-antitoxin system Phd/YefM family antitoxin n=1 Tax=Salmonirosea aquatica TaxID=2654236 RepID=UPI003570A618